MLEPDGEGLQDVDEVGEADELGERVAEREAVEEEVLVLELDGEGLQDIDEVGEGDEVGEEVLEPEQVEVVVAVADLDGDGLLVMVGVLVLELVAVIVISGVGLTEPVLDTVGVAVLVDVGLRLGLGGS